MATSASALQVLSFLLLISATVSGSIVFYLEEGEYDIDQGLFVINGSPTLFRSIPQSMWWVFVTMTTVGYGEMMPVTSLGRIVASATIVLGLVLVVFAVSVVDGNFQRESEAFYASPAARKIPKVSFSEPLTLNPQTLNPQTLKPLTLNS